MLLVQNVTIDSVVKYAMVAHEGQFRKHTNEPYFTHPMRVATTLCHMGLGTSSIVTGKQLLHFGLEA